MDDGKTSAGIAHGIGPQVAKEVSVTHQNPKAMCITSERQHKEEQERSCDPALSGMRGPGVRVSRRYAAVYQVAYQELWYFPTRIAIMK